MKKFLRRLTILVIVFLFLVAAALFTAGWLLDSALRGALEKQLAAATGDEAKVARVSMGLLSPTFKIENLTLRRPARAGGGTVLEIPEFSLEYDRTALWRRKLHLREVTLSLDHLSLMKRAPGRATSVSGTSLRSAHDANETAAAAEADPERAVGMANGPAVNDQHKARLEALVQRASLMLEGASQKASGGAARSLLEKLHFEGIDRLNLKVGNGQLTDPSDPGHSESVDFGVDQVFENLRNEQDFVGLVQTLMEKNEALGESVPSLEELKRIVSEVLRDNPELAALAKNPKAALGLSGLKKKLRH